MTVEYVGSWRGGRWWARAILADDSTRWFLGPGAMRRAEKWVTRSKP